MSEIATTLSVQEAAAAFAKEMAAMINAAAADAVGIDVMWFRARPDKRSQDVIFQSYTLYGVDDCPITVKAVYGDNGYDDAAITYNIMGLEYSVPLTLEIPVSTWNEAVNNDGSLPQRGDIAFIPLSNKLVEVVSMTPVKAIAAQITSYKVNCSIYKPTRSRLVGENLKTSIEENTENLHSRFGTEIKDTLKNVVDNKQLDMFNSTTRDKHKSVTGLHEDDGLITNKLIRNIISEDLIFDGHIVARTYYDMEIGNKTVVKYIKKDNIVEDDERCLSCWVKLKDAPDYRNIKKLSTDVTSHGVPTGEYIYIDEFSGKRFPAGTDVVIERGNIVICGKIDDSQKYRVKVHPNLIRGLSKNLKNWTGLTGYIIREDNIVNLLTGESPSGGLYVDVKANNYISINVNNSTILVQLNTRLKSNKWYGFIINIGKTISVDLFEGAPDIKHICGVNNIPNKYSLVGEYDYSIVKSPSYLTNIRLYDCFNNELDKQITDLVSYNTPYDSHAIINDSADTPLNKVYVGEQR